MKKRTSFSYATLLLVRAGLALAACGSQGDGDRSAADTNKGAWSTSTEATKTPGGTASEAAGETTGTNTFACAIPGHRAMGMKGTLVVR